MSAWDQFKDLSVTVCRDHSKKPLQWIYAVDDAWLHPSGFRTTGEIKKPVFTKGGNVSLDEWRARHLEILSDQGSAYDESDETSTEAENTTNENKDDANVADMLIRYAVEGHFRAGHRKTEADGTSKESEFLGYGVNFCSFEYFWAHFEEINRSFNAVIFDLRHALRDSGDLKVKWKDALEKTRLFSGFNIEMSNLHGWMLHFAAKLGRIGNQRCKIGRNHILILSSNLLGERKGDGTDSMKAFQQYATIQRDLWEHVSVGTGLLPDAHIVDFSFCPLPKNTGGVDEEAVLLDKGLEVFDRTFSKLASWSYQREALLRDIEKIWRTTEFGGGHFSKNVTIEQLSSCLRFDGWVSRNNYLNDYRAISFFDQREEGFSEDSFLEFLDWTVPSLGAKWNRPTLSGESPHLILPMRPGGAFLVAILDFIHAAANVSGKPNNTHVNPEVEYLRNGGNSQLLIKLLDSGVTVLEERMKEGKVPCLSWARAGQAVQRLRFPLLVEVLMRELDLDISTTEGFRGNKDQVAAGSSCIPSIDFEGSKITFTFLHHKQGPT